jgi:DNA (cytosine-5)-methyltransferase 1
LQSRQSRDSGSTQVAGIQSWRDIGGRSFWRNFDILPFIDGKARRVESGTFPLVDGIPRGVVPSCDISESYAQATSEARVMRLKGYGNAIVPAVAAEFILAFMECSE